ncbi:SGNH/GDSL hydrolase family protein [Humitalea sp. 24SJ18S-53]|uniref:SGNH/GDSL hydrolase family protein n=1 Tax=Humitalea sp. 24SJ18S-53 TaxID=3422307 RepID=UPI003D6665AD
MLLRLALLAGLAVGFVQPVAAEAIFVFGDSLSDGGNNFVLRGGANPRPPYAERSTNGPVWVELLAPMIGAETPVASRRGGTNYAYGGATSGPTAVYAATPSDGPGQLAEYLARTPAADPAALHVIWIGANDLAAIFRAEGIDGPLAGQAIAQTTANVATLVNTLAERGAKRFLLVTVPDRGIVPRYALDTPPIAANATQRSEALNAALVPAIRAIAEQRGLELRVFDAFATYRAVVADPARFGLVEARQVCWVGDALGNGTQCAAPDRFFYWDPAHPTTVGHRILAEAASRVMQAPPLVAAR